MDRKIELTKAKINSEEFDGFKKIKRKRIKRKLKHLEITKKKFEKIKQRSNKLNSIKDKINSDIEKEEKEEEDNMVVENDNNCTTTTMTTTIDNDEKKIEDIIKHNNNNHGTIKYYAQRYRLFSKYDQGIILDEESWFSVTPELIAQHIAERCSCNTIIDAFCGAGGNTIQFSFTCNMVISIDLDHMKLLMAKHNSWVYGHSNDNTNIEFVNCDAMRLSNLKADVVFLSPPWGGPNYTGSSIFNLDTMTPNGFEIFKNAIKVTPNIVYFLPKNTSKVDIAKLALISKENGGSDYCEIEENYINEKLKTITLYFGSLINNNKYT